MTVVSFRKKIVRRRRRRFIPRKRIFTAKSLTPRRTIYIYKGRFRLFKHRKPMPRLFRRFNTFVLPTGRRRAFSQKHTPEPKTKKYIPKAKIKKERTWAARPVEKEKSGGGQFGKAFIRERKKSFKEELKPSKPIKKKYNKGWFKKGEAPPQRNYKNYGVMRRLGPDPVIVIKPTVELAKAIKKEQKKLSKGWMSGAIKNSLDTLLGNIIKHAEMIIELYVPKDTGDLRASMMKEIKRRKRTGYRLEVRIGTPVMGRNLMTYANPVNHMPESMIQHDANKRSAKTRKMLFDPKAQKGWYEIIRLKLNNHIYKNLLPRFYQSLIRDAIEKSDLKIKRQKIGTTKVGPQPVIGNRNFTKEELTERWYTNWKGKKKYINIYATSVGPRAVVGHKPVNIRVTSEDYIDYLKERKRTFSQRLREGVELAKKNKPLQTSYKLTDVKKWFRIEIPFKR